MEFEDVEERIEWEARRIAAAFGIDPSSLVEEEIPPSTNSTSIRFRVWEIMLEETLRLAFTFRQEDDVFNWSQMCLQGSTIEQWCDLRLGLSDQYTWTRWSITNTGDLGERMARALYCLGFEVEEVLRQLPTLSAHEKMESHLSMPREFWPQSWLDEEAR